MVLPIAEIPILEGDDARRFVERIENVIPVSKKNYDRAKEVYFKMLENNDKLIIF